MADDDDESLYDLLREYLEHHRPKQVSTAEIIYNCAFCETEVRLPSSDPIVKNTGDLSVQVLCEKCAKEEMESSERESEWHDHLQSLRDRGVIVLSDYRNVIRFDDDIKV